MAIRKIWMVVKLPGGESNSATRNRDRNIVDEVLNGRDNIQISREDVPKLYYLNERAAHIACEKLAETNPMQPYAVLSIEDIKETGKPVVVRKQFTDEGELILV